MVFSRSQLESVDITARVSSCLSMTGSLVTITSYLSHAPLRKPFNRLAFCIAIANIFGCLAYSWGIHPVWAGRDSAFCQAQGFIIEWLVMTDPLLVLTMAVSVFMRVKARRSVDEIRLFENFGVVCAFVLPFIPALVFLIWRPKGYTVYGPAVLWCWISNESNILRLAAFYGPIWTIILCSIFFFSLSGRRIIHIRKKVNRAQGIHDDMDDHHERKFSFSPHRHFSFSNHMPGRTRSIDTSNTNSNNAPFPVGPDEDRVPISPLTSIVPPIPPTYSRHSDSSLTRVQTIEPSTSAGSYEPIIAHHHTVNSVVSPPIDHEAPHRRRRSTRFDTAHWKYARFALLCTLVLFITWVPISINHVYNNFISPGRPIYGLYFASAMCIPLHGFGNFVIYANTSWEEISTWAKSLFSRKRKLSSSAPGG